MLFFMPESPYYLAKKNATEETKSALRWFLYNDKLVQKAETDIQDYLKAKKEPTNDSEPNKDDERRQEAEVEEVRDSRTCYKLVVMSFLMAFTRTNGVTQLTYYMVDILKNSKSSAVIPPTYAAAGVSSFEAIGNN